jgi:hypothetical protein
MTIVLLILALVALGTLVVREPELRRRLISGVMRGQGAVRAAFGLFSPRDLQRQALALVKEKALVSIGFAHLPTDVVVLVNPDDLEALAATREHVTRELAEQIAALDGTNAGGSTVFALGARPQVKLAPSAEVPAGTVDVKAAWLEGTVAVTALLAAEEGPAPGRGPRLRIEVDGQDPSEVVLVGRMTVGRAPGSDIAINHEGVSREHALLNVAAPGQVTIVDRGSVNGVEPEGAGRIAPNQPVPIRPGETVRLGKHVRLELVSEPTEPMPAARGDDVED